MNRGERKIPVNIHVNAEEKRQPADGADYFEEAEQEKTDSIIDESSDRVERETPEEPVSEEDLDNNIMQGLIEHQEETPSKKISRKNKRELFLWFFVAIFSLAFLAVWLINTRISFNDIAVKLSESDNQKSIDSISDKFKEDFDQIKTNVSDYQIFTDYIKKEQSQQQAIDELKNKLESESDIKSLPQPLEPNNQ
ncbi:MAG TPA: hypothetical protein VMX18_04320 [Candidatus Bipolaricaulota bacterium]|nr:hypothetical protein [Candidatus Bipolaricaulota bacterium]